MVGPLTQNGEEEAGLDSDWVARVFDVPDSETCKERLDWIKEQEEGSKSPNPTPLIFAAPLTQLFAMQVKGAFCLGKFILAAIGAVAVMEQVLYRDLIRIDEYETGDTPTFGVVLSDALEHDLISEDEHGAADEVRDERNALVHYRDPTWRDYPFPDVDEMDPGTILNIDVAEEQARNAIKAMIMIAASVEENMLNRRETEAG